MTNKTSHSTPKAAKLSKKKQPITPEEGVLVSLVETENGVEVVPFQPQAEQFGPEFPEDASSLIPDNHPAVVAQQPVAESNVVKLSDAKAEKRASKPGRKFVVQVTGAGLGRGRYITPAGTFDPWKFHALQFDTHAEAKEHLIAVKEDTVDGQYLKVLPFDGAWYESPEEEAANAAKSKSAKKAAAAVAAPVDPNQL